MTNNNNNNNNDDDNNDKCVPTKRSHLIYPAVLVKKKMLFILMYDSKGSRNHSAEMIYMDGNYSVDIIVRVIIARPML